MLRILKKEKKKKNDLASDIFKEPIKIPNKGKL